MTKFRTVWGLVAGIAVVALVVGGLAVASNMGFKFVPNIPGTPGQNAFNLSLPWNNNYSTAEDLRSDIASYGNVDRVSKVTGRSNFQDWTGMSGTNFPIQKGEAYVVYGGSGGVQPVIVGSHDPNFTLSFPGGEAFNAAAPYHQTLSTAEELRKDIESQFPGTVDRVSKVTTRSNFQDWTGMSGTNFALDLGMGVVVYCNQDVNGYVWPHY